SHAQEDVPRVLVLGDRLERLDVPKPQVVHMGATSVARCGLRRIGYGVPARRSRASASSSSCTSPSTGTWTPVDPTFASNPVKSKTVALMRAASAGSTLVARRSLVRAPAARAARSAARTE